MGETFVAEVQGVDFRKPVAQYIIQQIKDAAAVVCDLPILYIYIYIVFFFFHKLISAWCFGFP